MGCGPSEFATDQEREDELVRVQQGKYYGHPHPKCAVNISGRGSRM
jgi:glucose/arabinose dehydrogenase